MKTEKIYLPGNRIYVRVFEILPTSRNKKGENSARFFHNDYLTIFEIDSKLFHNAFEYDKSPGYWKTKDKNCILLLDISQRVTVINKGKARK